MTNTFQLVRVIALGNRTVTVPASVVRFPTEAAARKYAMVALVDVPGGYVVRRERFSERPL